MEKKDKKIRIIILILLVIILLCLGYLAWLFLGYYHTDTVYDGVKEEYVDMGTDIPDAEPEDKEWYPDRDIDMDGLLSENPDFLCWIYYEDGKVDYPVVKERVDDINGWMHRSFDGTKSSAGTIFMPYDADSGFTDLNTFLYGHNMANGSMFGSMKLIYRNLKENYMDPYFYIWTKDGKKMKYRVITMYVVDKNSVAYAVPQTKEGYDEYLDQILGVGTMGNLIPFTDKEKAAMENGNPIVTLSTCYGYAGTSNRLLVQGIEIDRQECK